MSFFGWIAKLLSEYWRLFLEGTAYTLIMALVGTVAGFLIGLLVAMVRTVPVRKTDSAVKKILMRAVNFVLSAYVEIIRGTPLMVQALIIH